MFGGEDGRRKTGDGRQKTEDGRRKTEDGRRETEDRRQETEDRRRETEDRMSDMFQLATERLLLRELKDRDDNALFFLRSDASVNKYIDRSPPKDIEEVRAFIAKIKEGTAHNKSFYWAVCLKESPELIGTAGLWNFSDDRTVAEIGYELIPSFQGQGLMNEALKCILHYGFQTIGLTRIDAHINNDNDRSIRLLVKNNFKPTLRKEEKSNNVIFTLKKNRLTSVLS